MANLEVVVPPEISDKHSTADMNINEGSAAKFVCSATGEPTWNVLFRSGMKVTRPKQIVTRQPWYTRIF